MSTKRLPVEKNLFLYVLQARNVNRLASITGVPDDAEVVGAEYDGRRITLLIETNEESESDTLDVVIHESAVTIWIAGTNKDDGSPWEVIGAFWTEEEAAAYCKNWEDFIGPLEVGTAFPDETVTWPCCRFPVAEREKAKERGTSDE